jgi:RimJ/RimL family protein N-acetyltransferase
MDFPRTVVTERLELRATVAEDADELFPIMSDPEGWWFDPDARHEDVAQTRAFVARAASRWSEGMSYWTVRGLTSGRVIGIGGAQRHASGCWNLSYRIATDAWGRGYATELATAAADTAVAIDPGVPVVAWVAEHNQPSRRVAERLGFTNYGPYVDANDGEMRLAYADRPVKGFLR